MPLFLLNPNNCSEHGNFNVFFFCVIECTSNVKWGGMEWNGTEWGGVVWCGIRWCGWRRTKLDSSLQWSGEEGLQ